MPKNAARSRAITKRRPKAKARPKPTRTPLDRLRAICLALPQSTEVEAWGAPTFRVGKLFAMYSSPSSHHSAGRPAVWIYSVSVEQDLVIRSRPDKYFKPAYVGAYGWIGAWLDKNPPWAEIEELLRDAWRRRAPKRVLPLLDHDSRGTPPISAAVSDARGAAKRVRASTSRRRARSSSP